MIRRTIVYALKHLNLRTAMKSRKLIEAFIIPKLGRVAYTIHKGIIRRGSGILSGCFYDPKAGVDSLLTPQRKSSEGDLAPHVGIYSI